MTTAKNEVFIQVFNEVFFVGGGVYWVGVFPSGANEQIFGNCEGGSPHPPVGKTLVGEVKIRLNKASIQLFNQLSSQGNPEQSSGAVWKKRVLNIWAKFLEIPVKEKRELLHRYFARILPRFLAVSCCFYKFPEHLYSTMLLMAASVAMGK